MIVEEHWMYGRPFAILALLAVLASWPGLGFAINLGFRLDPGNPGTGNG